MTLRRVAARAVLWVMPTAKLREAVEHLGAMTAHQEVLYLLLNEYARRQGDDAKDALREKIGLIRRPGSRRAPSRS